MKLLDFQIVKKLLEPLGLEVESKEFAGGNEPGHPFWGNQWGEGRGKTDDIGGGVKEVIYEGFVIRPQTSQKFKGKFVIGQPGSAAPVAFARSIEEAKKQIDRVLRARRMFD